VAPTVKLVGSLFDQTMNKAPSLPGLYSAPGAPGAPAAVLAPSVRCYARDDVTGVYSRTEVLKGGLFLAEKYTRVLGGMIYNPRYGWYGAVAFGCAEGLDQLEVEFVPSVLVTPTPTRRPATVVPKAVATVPIPSPVPSPTLTTGIVSFSAPSCSLVSYLAWNVKAAYLIRGGVKTGVPGDWGGQAVLTSVCPYSGTLTLAVVFADGTIASCDVVVP
jgi:hypothetical protein